LARDVAAAASLALAISEAEPLLFNETDFGAIDVDVVRLES
jgi:uncharacterized protein with PIN domain